MFNFDELLQGIIPEIKSQMRVSMDNPVYIEAPEDIPRHKGAHYVILCNKPVPETSYRGNPEDVTYGDLFLWHNGTTTGWSRDRAKSHLFRSHKSRIAPKAFNAINIESVPLSEIPNWKHNHHLTPCGERIFVPGVDIREPQWEGYKFYVVINAGKDLANMMERLFREDYGVPAMVVHKSK